METSFQFSFSTSKSPNEVYALLLDPNSWWVGLYNETIQGKSELIHDEFAFSAGGGMHFSVQQLVEAIPHQRIEWLVTESRLTFLNDPKEWEGSKISFTIEWANNRTAILFKHEGLLPSLECYGSCSNAWTLYLNKLEKLLL